MIYKYLYMKMNGTIGINGYSVFNSKGAFTSNDQGPKILTNMVRIIDKKYLQL